MKEYVDVLPTSYTRGLVILFIAAPYLSISLRSPYPYTTYTLPGKMRFVLFSNKLTR